MTTSTTRVGNDALTSNQAELGEQQFMTMLAQEVIPRLILLEQESACLNPETRPKTSLGQQANPALALRLADLAAQEELHHSRHFVLSLIRHGVSLESIFLDLLQPAARHLGDRWKEDSCNFAEVTLGLWNIQQIFAELLAEFRGQRGGFSPSQDPARTALFCTLPGCHHRFGVQMITAFFCRAGWAAQLVQAPSEADLLIQIQGVAPDLLGLSVASQKEVQQAGHFIMRVRELRLPKPPVIMMGGPAIAAFPDIAERAGADLISGDAPEALSLACATFDGIPRGPR